MNQKYLKIKNIVYHADISTEVNSSWRVKGGQKSVSQKFHGKRVQGYYLASNNFNYKIIIVAFFPFRMMLKSRWAWNFQLAH
jgi:hypothetical protein